MCLHLFTFISSRKREIRKLQLQRNCPVTAKKCTKKGDERCCYAFSINCSFDVLVLYSRPRDKLSYIHATMDSFSCRHEKLSDTVWTLIRYVTLHLSARRSFAPLEKSRRNRRFYVWTSPIPYSFLAGAKAIQYSVNIALNSLVTMMRMNSLVQVF